jgi:thiamine-phosphate pyrophosphorylase
MMKSDDIDYSLYLVTDRRLAGNRPLETIVAAAVRGGVTCVQLREKDCTSREFIARALALKKQLISAQIPLIINDRVDIAQAVGADGVHLGQTDMPLQMAKAILKDAMLIGISAESFKDAIEAEKGGADYISVSPIYPTPTKTDTAAPLGLAGVRDIRRAVTVPLIGIGGLDAQNAADVIKAGADGVAVVSAIVGADDPERAAFKLRSVITQAKTDDPQ